MPAAFEYPDDAPECRHGPQGYVDALSYHPWLRDEFAFRCVYCLLREQWGRALAEFDVDHFRPQVKDPALGLVYENLVNACHTCNLLKGARDLPDPRRVLTTKCVQVNPDGGIVGLTDDARKVVAVLGLNSEAFKRWRLLWMRNVELAKDYDPVQYRRLMGFPDHLPDLRRLRPPGGNARPEGLEESFFAKRRRGELPETY